MLDFLHHLLGGPLLGLDEAVIESVAHQLLKRGPQTRGEALAHSLLGGILVLVRAVLSLLDQFILQADRHLGEVVLALLLEVEVDLAEGGLEEGGVEFADAVARVDFEGF